MKVILIKDVPGLGQKYDVREVKDGYARNFLIPQKMAEIATPSALKSLAEKKIRAEQERAVKKDILEKMIKDINGMRIEVFRKVNEKGHLFDAVGKKDIAEILKEKRVEIPEKMISLETPIKETGEHKVKIGDGEVILIILPEK